MDRLPQRETYCTIAPGTLNYKCLGTLAPFMASRDPLMVANTVSLRSIVIDLNMLTKASTTVRKTKIMATLGPASEPDGVLDEMIRKGVNAARIVLPVNKIQESRAMLQKFQKVSISATLHITSAIILLYSITQSTGARPAYIDTAIYKSVFNIYIYCAMQILIYLRVSLTANIRTARLLWGKITRQPW